MTTQQPQQTEGGYELAPQADALGYLTMIAEDYRRAPGAAAVSVGDTPGIDLSRRRPEEGDLSPTLRALVEQARAVYPASRLSLLKYRRTLNDAVAVEVDDGEPLPGADAMAVLSVSTSSTMRGFSELAVEMLIAAWDGAGPAGDPTI